MVGNLPPRWRISSNFAVAPIQMKLEFMPFTSADLSTRDLSSAVNFAHFELIVYWIDSSGHRLWIRFGHLSYEYPQKWCKMYSFWVWVANQICSHGSQPELTSETARVSQSMKIKELAGKEKLWHRIFSKEENGVESRNKLFIIVTLLFVISNTLEDSFTPNTE